MVILKAQLMLLNIITLIILLKKKKEKEEQNTIKEIKVNQLVTYLLEQR